MAVCVRKLSIESFSKNVCYSCSFKRPLKELHLCLLYFDLTSQKIILEFFYIMSLYNILQRMTLIVLYYAVAVVTQDYL